MFIRFDLPVLMPSIFLWSHVKIIEHISDMTDIRIEQSRTQYKICLGIKVQQCYM